MKNDSFQGLDSMTLFGSGTTIGGGSHKDEYFAQIIIVVYDMFSCLL